jgi:hypothetical protein
VEVEVFSRSQSEVEEGDADQLRHAPYDLLDFLAPLGVAA